MLVSIHLFDMQQCTEPELNAYRNCLYAPAGLECGVLHHADGYLAQAEIERLAEETKEIQRQNEKRRNYGFQVDMLEDPTTVLERARKADAIRAQLKRIEE